MKKEYICPRIIVKDVEMTSCFLGISNPMPQNGTNGVCESWVDNMNSILGGKDGDRHGTFSNSFSVGSGIWGDDQIDAL